MADDYLELNSLINNFLETVSMMSGTFISLESPITDLIEASSLEYADVHAD